MNRSFFLIPFIFLIIVIIFELFFYFGNINLFKEKPKQTVALSTKTVDSVKEDTEVLPIRLNNQNVKAININYLFRAVVEDVKKTSNGTEVVTNIKDDAVPPFLVEKTTKITLNKNGDIIAYSLNNLKKGQRADITINFDINKKKWRLSHINVLEDKIASPSPVNK